MYPPALKHQSKALSISLLGLRLTQTIRIVFVAVARLLSTTVPGLTPHNLSPLSWNRHRTQWTFLVTGFKTYSLQLQDPMKKGMNVTWCRHDQINFVILRQKGYKLVCVANNSALRIPCLFIFSLHPWLWFSHYRKIKQLNYNYYDFLSEKVFEIFPKKILKAAGYEAQFWNKI